MLRNLWLSRLVSSLAPRRSRSSQQARSRLTRRPCRPALESLETRLTPATLIDNGEAGYFDFGPDWTDYPAGYGGDLRYAPPGDGSQLAAWLVTGLTAGTYMVQTTWIGSAGWAPDVPFHLFDGDTYLETVLIDQQQDPVGEVVDGSVFQTLTTVTVTSGTLWVVLTNNASGWFMADAVRVTADIPDSLDLAFSTYLGGNLFEHVRDVTTDREGNIYVTGGTLSADFPVTPGAYQTTHYRDIQPPDNPQIDPFDVFVVKLDPRGQLLWSTFLGGRNYDRAYAIEVDSLGYVYVAGRAGRAFPVTPGAFQTQFMGGQEAAFYGPQDGFIAKLSPDGSSLVWASYFGTSDPRIIRDIAVDANGDVYLASSRQSGSYPPAVAQAFQYGFQPTPQGGIDGVVAKVSSDGTQVLWASYLGGSGSENSGPAVRVDAFGSPYFLYSTNSTDIPTTPGAYDRTFNGGLNDLYVARFTPDGSGLIFGTYLGGSGQEAVETHSLALDAQGNAYVTPSTSSPNFPTTPGAFQRTYGGGPIDVAIAKLSSDGTQLLASTFIGGDAGDHSEGIAVDVNGNVYISGLTGSTDFPLTPDAYQAQRRGVNDLIAVKLSADFQTLACSTLLGGTAIDYGRAAWADSLGNFYVAGQSASTDWPTRNPLQPAFGGGTGDAVVAKFTPNAGGPFRLAGVWVNDGAAQRSRLGEPAYLWYFDHDGDGDVDDEDWLEFHARSGGG